MESIYHMKSICNKLKISPFLILIIFLSFLSGLFKDVITLFLVIIIHELGHVITSLVYGWKIKRIDITVCGGFITYDEEIDKPFKEEFLISISGFLFQLLLCILSSILNRMGIFSNKLLFMIQKYNLSIFLFNILPIYPLDGSKILNVFFNMFLPYKKALKLTTIISVLGIVFMFLCFFLNGIKIEYSYIMIVCFVFSKIINLFKDIPYLFNRFLFERYKNPIKLRKICYVKNGLLDGFRRQRKHYFIINNHCYDERKVLSKRFD